MRRCSIIIINLAMSDLYQRMISTSEQDCTAPLSFIIPLAVPCRPLQYLQCSVGFWCRHRLISRLKANRSVGAPACGDVMKLQIRVDESGRISDVKFKTFGCGSAIASSSFMTERVKGLTLEEAAAIRNTEVAKELSLPPVKCTV